MVDYAVIDMDPTIPDTYAALDEYLQGAWRNTRGVDMPIAAVALDGGDMQVPRARLPAYQGQGATAPAGPHDPVDVELARMDSTHPGWRDTLKSQDFHDWLATQNPRMKAAVDTADTAQ